jgi:hypothetical protein
VQTRGKVVALEAIKVLVRFGWGLGVLDLGFGVWGLEFGVWNLELEIGGLGCETGAVFLRRAGWRGNVQLLRGFLQAIMVCG